MQGQQQETAQGLNPQDPSGGGAGNIGVGNAPIPEEPGFSGTDQPQGAPPQMPPDLGGMQ